MPILNFKGDLISGQVFDEFDRAGAAAGLYAIVGWFESDIIEAYAEQGETIDPGSDFVHTWFSNFDAELQQAMLDAGRAKIRELVAREVQPDQAETEAPHVPS
jgi:hypothetical protein